MATLAYTRGVEAILNGSVNLGTATVRAMLTTMVYAEAKNAHQFRSQVTNEVANGAGYQSGGVPVSVSVAGDYVNSRIDITFGTATWTVPTGQTLAFRKVIYYVSTGNPATDRLLAVNDLVSDQGGTNQPVNVLGSVIRVPN